MQTFRRGQADRPASQPLDPRTHVDGLALDPRRMFLPNRVLLSRHMPLRGSPALSAIARETTGLQQRLPCEEDRLLPSAKDIRSPLVRAVQHVRHHRGSLSPGWCCSAQTPRQDSRSPALKHLPLTTPEPCLDRPQIRGRWPGCPNPRLSRPAPAPSAPRTPVSHARACHASPKNTLRTKCRGMDARGPHWDGHGPAGCHALANPDHHSRHAGKSAARCPSHEVVGSEVWVERLPRQHAA